MKQSLFKDYLLARLWTVWLDRKEYDVDNSYELLDDMTIVGEFGQYLTYITENADNFKSLGINSRSDLAEEIKKSYNKLADSSINF